MVCLVPARTDNRWWHDFAMRGEILLIQGCALAQRCFKTLHRAISEGFVHQRASCTALKAGALKSFRQSERLNDLRLQFKTPCFFGTGV